MSVPSEGLLQALSERSEWVDAVLLDDALLGRLRTAHLREVVRAYLARGGKRLRPAVMMFCCGAVGGDEKAILPAAAALELFHTWTLLHDDIIDQDDLRRGGPTGHVLGEELGAQAYGLQPPTSADYGQTLSILAGDVQHGLCVTLFLRCQAPPELVIQLATSLEYQVVGDLVDGETIDVQLEKRSIEQVSLDEVLQMVYLKTAALYEFAGRAGAMFGLGTRDEVHPHVQALSTFCANCGIAFQLQDDILGVVGDQSKLGKPVGSDITSGKRTPILLAAWEAADAAQRDVLTAALGCPEATADQVDRAVQVMRETGAVERVAALAREKLETAFGSLEAVPPSKYRSWLEAWGHFMVERDL